MRSCNVCCLVLGLVLLSAGTARAAEIQFKEFSIAPLKFKQGEDLKIQAAVELKGLPLVSFVLRTTEALPKEAVPPPFSLYDAQRQFANLPERGQGNLRDNGTVDEDPATKAFAVTLSTQGWKPGRYAFSLFAHNRPLPGRHIVDERAFVITIEGDSGRVEYMAPKVAPRFLDCAFEQSVMVPGESVLLQIKVEGALQGVQVQHQYHMDQKDTPPGLRFDEKTHVAYLADDASTLVLDNGPNDLNLSEGAMTIHLDTETWKAGLYHFAVIAVGPGGLRSAQRDLAFKLRAPEDTLEVTVSSSWRLYKGTHAECVAPLRNGDLVYVNRYSTDKGKSWTKLEKGTLGPGAYQLRDGRILGMDYRCLPIEGRKGWYRNSRYISTDNGRTVEEAGAAEFYVPQAKGAIGHAPHPGPLYMRSMVERDDGSLVALMAGWFIGDDTPCPYSKKRPYSRTYCCESKDEGKSWSFLATIGYAHLGSEGYNEGSMRTLPDGRLMAVMRTGSMSSKTCHDNPIMTAFSEDGGKSWSEPQRIGVNGAFPNLCVLSDGLLAVTYGRPGACIIFSTDGGKTWSDRTIIDPTKYSGYVTLCETGPGEILVIFGARDFYDAETGERRDDIRAAYVRYSQESDTGVQAAVETLDQAGLRTVDLGAGFLECQGAFEALEKEERFLVHLPRGYDPQRKEPYPMILFLHGAGRHCRTLFEHPATKAVLAWSPAVVVMPNGGGSWWVDSPVNAASQYQSYLDEVLALSEESLNISTQSEHRALGGWSMGGFGSMNYLIAHPDHFSAWGGILALLDFPNAAYPAEQNHAVPSVLGPEADQFNPIRGIELLKAKHLSFITGANAFDRSMNDAFHQRLLAADFSHHYSRIPGEHTFDVVIDAFPRIMRFLADVTTR